MKNGKKRPVILNIGIGILLFFAIIIAFFGAWTIICLTDTYDPVNALPEQFTVYVRTDSFWQAVEPLLDLQVADMVLARPEFSDFRELFIDLRSSALRKNFFVKQILSRRIDAAAYTDSEGRSDYIAVVKMDFLSAVSRFAPVTAPLLDIPGLVYVSSASYSGFEYRTADGVLYIKPVKNLLIITANRNLLLQSLSLLEEKKVNTQISAEQETDTDNPIRITVNVKNLFNLLPQDERIWTKIREYFSAQNFAQVSFGITDMQIRVNVQVPFNVPPVRDPFAPFLNTDSTLPAIISRLPDSTQYYTVLNAGTLSELKNAAVPFLPAGLNFDSVWNSADSMSRFLFSMPLSDLIFSWTGKEFGVVGLEGKTDPVFAVQIKDEKRRQEIFNTFLSSFVIQDGTSFIYNGIRIPCLQIPQFFQNVLAAFDIKLPRPYYLVQDGFIYFSESPENLSEIYTAHSQSKNIFKNANWAEVSQYAPAQVSASLFYNLERSLPFFVRGNSLISDIFRLYNMGRCDVSVKNGVLICNLSAAAKRNTTADPVYGYPIPLQGSADPDLILAETKNTAHIYWIENGSTVRQLDTKTLQTVSYELPEKSFISKAENNGGEVWAVTAQGAVYLFNAALQPVQGFPVLTGEKPKAAGTDLNGSFLFPAEHNVMCSVSASGSAVTIPVPAAGSLLSKPAVLNGIAAVYSKSFGGELFYLNETSCLNPQAPLKVNGIAFGSPAMAQIDGDTYTAFITQAGLFYLWKNGVPAAGFPIKCDGIFYTNVQNAGSYFFALSSDATLYRMDLNGNMVSVRIPNYSAKSGILTVADYDADGRYELFVSPDGNVIYGFSSDLELLHSFPRPGWGRPVFTDTTGNKKREMIVLTADKKLTAWKITQ